MLDPDTAQEYIDDARREAERCADVAIADLKAELEQTRYDLRIARHRAANHESLEDQWMAASRRILEMQSDAINAATEREALRAQLLELEPLRPLLQVLHGALSAKDHMTIRHTPMEKVIEIGHMTVHVYGGRSVQLVQALYDAGQSVMVPK